MPLPQSNVMARDPTPPPSQLPQTASSPTSTSHKGAVSNPSADTLPLDHPSRTCPIHPLLPTVLVSTDTTTTATNPLTLQPFTEAELKTFNFEKVLADYKHLPKPEIEKLRDEAAKALKEKIEEREAKLREVEKEIEEKEKIREVERKVYRKKMEGRKGGDD
ncbi:hypothetical protein DV736_g1362, partial [Chaetothyriales sp. CBS 134916]